MTLISFYIEGKFGMGAGQLGTILSAASFMSSMGNILASSISKRIGLVKTMVFTHLPSAIFLALLPLPRSLALTIVLLVSRSSLASMDQAPRSTFLSAVVLAEERTAIMGIVNTVKTASQSAGPLIAGSLADSDRFWIAFVLAGSLKASCDIGMLAMFKNVDLSPRRTETAGNATSRSRAEDEALDEEFEMDDSSSVRSNDSNDGVPTRKPR